MKPFCLSLLFCLISANAFAQSIELPAPAGWSAIENGISDHRIAVWREPETESRIEILTQRIVRTQHAETFFSALHNQLLENNFSLTTPAKTLSITLSDGTERSGNWTEYEFLTAEVPITVVTFEFALDDAAFIAVGYFARANAPEGIEKLKAILPLMTKSSPSP